MVRIEKELQQKELRQEMKLRLARLQHQQHQQQNKPHIIISDPLLHGVMSKNMMSSPSPITPNSTDELLPSVDETQEVCILIIILSLVNNLIRLIMSTKRAVNNYVFN